MLRTLTLLLAAVALPWLAACGTGDEGAATPTEPVETVLEATAVITAVASPTVVARQEPPPTPTIDPQAQPFAPVEVEGLPGIVVPAAAQLAAEVDEATEAESARADFTMAGTTSDELAAWFEEQWEALGWSLSETRDTALVFIHEEVLSAQFAEEGLKRSATVFFDTVEDAEDEESSFTIVAEAPEGGAAE